MSVLSGSLHRVFETAAVRIPSSVFWQQCRSMKSRSGDRNKRSSYQGKSSSSPSTSKFELKTFKSSGAFKKDLSKTFPGRSGFAARDGKSSTFTKRNTDRADDSFSDSRKDKHRSKSSAYTSDPFDKKSSTRQPLKKSYSFGKSEYPRTKYPSSTKSDKASKFVKRSHSSSNGSGKTSAFIKRKPSSSDEFQEAPTPVERKTPTFKGGDKQRPKSKRPAFRNELSPEVIDKRMKSKIYFNYGLNYGRLVEKSSDISPSISVIDKITKFEELKLLPETRNLVKDILYKDSIMTNDRAEDIEPSPIQTQAIFTINKTIDKLEASGEDKTRHGKMKIYTIAAETGSGKTMAYLAPLLDYLNRYNTTTTKNAIRSVILLPSQELIHQVYKTLKCSPECILNVEKWDNSVSYNDMVEKLKNRIDILITTPGKIDETLFNINKIGHPQSLLNHCEFAVVDEADTLMSKTFLDSTKSALRKLPNLTHLVFCSATIPKEFHSILNSMFLENSNVIITTPKLHRLSHNLKFFNIDSTLSPLKGNKLRALEQILTAINNDNTEPNSVEKRCIVFVNKKITVTEIVEKLQNRYLKLVGFSGSDTIEERLSKLAPFIEPPVKVDESNYIDELMEKEKADNQEFEAFEKDEVEKFKTIAGSNIAIPKNYKPAAPEEQTVNERLNVLVTTDLLARGLNFNGVRNVILYDVPQTSIDLIHRCGRTARYKQGGRVFMITDKTTKAWAKAIPTIIKKRKNIT